MYHRLATDIEELASLALSPVAESFEQKPSMGKCACVGFAHIDE